MSKKKATTTEGRARKAAPLVTPAERRAAREIARHIAATLNHPLCPRDVYDQVADATAGATPGEIADSAPYVEQVMLGHFAEGRRGALGRKGGAR